METLHPVLVILIGLVLRLAVPVALTVLIVYLLGKLDARWQAEARDEEKALAVDQMPCLKNEELSVEQMKLRMSLSEQPCWQAQRSQSGYLNEACLDCEVFLSAPAHTSHSHVNI